MKLKKQIKSELLALRITGKTYREIGQIYHVSHERIRQIIGGGRIKKYPIGYKKCYGLCKQIKLLEQFYKPYYSRCILCTKALARVYMDKKYQKDYRAGGKYWEHQKARMNLAYYIKKGKIIKPNICSINNNCYGRIEGHHYKGYDKEYWLDVQWLCKKHHQLADKNLLN